MKDYVKDSIFGSITVQIITLFVNFYGLSLSVAPSDFILQEILGLETIVQMIELGFYGWYANKAQEKLFDVARYRYYDWILTTPMMLFSTMAFYQYLFSKDEEAKDEKKSPMTLQGFFQQHSSTILLVFFFNALMLVFGYMAELGTLSTFWSSILGYGALLGSFGYIFKDFVRKVEWGRQGIFWLMFFFWSLYGVAALFENHAKNVSYNILDLFAKNFYGLFLTWYINGLKI
jgi:hypothetical protein